LAYDDGEKELAVIKGRIKPLIKQLSPQRRTKLQEGESIEANYKGRGKWYKGTVSSDKGDGTYDILYDDLTVKEHLELFAIFKGTPK
jgi:hypothetical protein